MSHILGLISPVCSGVRRPPLSARDVCVMVTPSRCAAALENLAAFLGFGVGGGWGA